MLYKCVVHFHETLSLCVSINQENFKFYITYKHISKIVMPTHIFKIMLLLLFSAFSHSHRKASSLAMIC